MEREFRVFGPPGCLRGDTEIYDPVDGSSVCVADRWLSGRDFHIWSLGDHRCFVQAYACAPVRYHRTAMYSLLFSDGTVIHVTAEHRLLDFDGWVSVSELIRETPTEFRVRAFWHVDATEFGPNKLLSGSVRLVSIEPAGEDVYYDFHVPAYNNYWAAGLIHHNCGKTTWLVRQAASALEAMKAKGVDPFDDAASGGILFTSLTRAAAGELRSRGVEVARECIGTLHSHALRALAAAQGSQPKLCESPKEFRLWNSFCPEMRLTDPSAADQDTYGRKPDGDGLLQQYKMARSRLLDRELWPASLTKFATKWEMFKSLYGYLDFSDVIDEAYRVCDTAPGNPSIIFGDEQQDSDRAQFRLMRKWGSAANVERIIMVGDPDQCHPAGTMIRLARHSGDVPIESLSPDEHRILSFDRHGALVTGYTSGYSFRKSVRPFTGKMATVTAGGNSVDCTPNHRWPIQWRVPKGLCCVYIMRKGEHFRVGWCQLMGQCGFHFSARCRLDSADEGWILKLFSDRREASMYESLMAARYGLQLPSFKEHRYFDQLTEDDRRITRERTVTCLDAHNRNVDYPFWKKVDLYEKKGMRTSFDVCACNILDDVMVIPVPRATSGKEVGWLPASVSWRSVVDVPVWSLDVDRYHNYIANGLVTNNSIFQWRGSDPAAFTGRELPPENVRVLSQSYRVPRSVHQISIEMITRVRDRVKVEYNPRDADGDVRRIKLSFRDADLLARMVRDESVTHGRTAMILATCEYQLRPVMAALKKYGIPFWNPYSENRGDFNPLHPSRGRSTAVRVLDFLRPSPDHWGDSAALWTAQELFSWVEICAVDGWLVKGAKSHIENLANKEPGRLLALDELLGFFVGGVMPEGLASLDLNWLKVRLMAAKQKSAEYALTILDKYGAGGLRNEPAVTVGTVHSCKGGESDDVIISPDISYQAYETMRTADSHGRDAMYRLFYVAMTRAKERLFLCSPSNPSQHGMAINWHKPIQL